MKSIVSILLIALSTQGVLSQNIDLSEAEATLEGLLIELRSAVTDTDKESKNKAFKAELEKVLRNKEAMYYPFASLTTVGFIDSPDKQMRIVNWNVEQDDFSHSYNCFVLHIDSRRNDYFVTELNDISFGMPQQPTEIISSDEWYGALYYAIIPIKKGSKTIYTLLGWDYFTSMSQMRVIDAMYFTGKTVKLGSPIFKVGKETYKRMMYEHSKKASMSLTYDAQRERIIFDHLSPEAPSMKNFKSFYVPDMTYDAFVLEGSSWVLEEDVIGTNHGEDNKQVVYVLNDKTGKVEKRTINAKWINPEDPSAPDGGSEHVAVTPESRIEDLEKEGTAKEPKIDKHDKRDPSEVSFYRDVNKKKNKRRNKNR